jgi:signal transduction histidine kinase
MRSLVFADVEGASAERVIAGARLLLVTAAALAEWLDPTSPVEDASVLLRLLWMYALFALAVLGWLLIGPGLPSRLPHVTQAADLGFATLLVLSMAGPGSAPVVFLVFGVLTAAHRWGFGGALAAGGFVVGAMGLAPALIRSGILGPAIPGAVDVNRMLVFAGLLAVLGLLLATLAEHERRHRVEASHLASVMGKASVRAGIRGTTEAVFADVLQLFRARRAMLVVRDSATGAAYVWDSDPPHRDRHTTFAPLAIDPASGEPEFFPMPGDGWHASSGRRAPPGTFDVLALDAHGRPLPAAQMVLPPSFLAKYPCCSLLGVTMRLGDDWSGRTYLLDPAPGDRRRAIRLAQRLAHDVGPATYNVFLIHRLRARVAVQERARLARELHDGVVQSLIGSQMHAHVLQRRAFTEAPSLAADLSRLHDLLEEQVLALRDLTQRLRTVDVAPRHLLEQVAEIVDRFQRDTGIAARFVTNVQNARFSPRAHREVALIVLESLVNIRKHSGARHVLVRLAADGDGWVLSVEDDGRGFPFAGRLSHAQLDALHQGPAAIKEHVSALEGELIVESRPGEGARLEIAFR